MKASHSDNKRSVIIALITFLLITIYPSAKAQNAPINLRCFDKENPVGTDESPYFGWYLNANNRNEIQSAYQVLVASSVELLNTNPDLWNSGKVNSSLQNYIYYSGKPLQAGKQYYWKVKIWDRSDNESSFSKTATFETGLFTNDDWSGAKWIKRNNTSADDYTYYRKKFAIPGTKIKRATVYITAVHDYELYLNGDLVGKGPVYHYPQYQYYNSYDITNLLNNDADNLFSVFTHWYGKGQGRPESERGLLVKTIIEYANATQLVIGTDSTWLQKRAEAWDPNQPRRNGEGIGYQEYIDFRNQIPDWNLLSYNDADWNPSYEIGEHPVEPWIGKLQPDLNRLIENEITPVSVTNVGENSYVIDLGKVYAGVPKISFSGGETGQKVDLLGGYTLDNDGNVSTTTNQSTDMHYNCILNGNKVVFQPKVYLGMRYIQVFNSPVALTVDNCKFVSRHYQLDPARADFQSSNDTLKKVWDLMAHSLTLGAQESFVDTPTREKGGFLGDSWSIGVAAMTTMGDRLMNKRILLEFLDSQDQYWPDGRLNAVYPNGDGARDIPDYTQMFPVWVWDYYMQTGDKKFLTDNYDRIAKVVAYVNEYRNEKTGLIHNLDGGSGPYLYGIVDWPDQMRYGYDMSVESRTVQDVYAYLDFDILAKIAEITGHTKDHDLYSKNALQIKKAINKSLINKSGLYIDGINADLSQSKHVSQHANMFPMAAQIVPEKNIEQVVELIKSKHMSVGMVTLRWLPEALGQAEEGAHLLELYTNNQWDGWAKIIAHGGTATWESWDAANNQSMSHPWGAAGLLGIQQYFLGITPLKPQHEIIQVKPLDFENKLEFVSGKLPTDRGDINIYWTRTDNLFKMVLTIPNNVTAKVYIPKSGTEGTEVIVGDSKINGIDTGNYIFAGEYGSGNYTFKRIATP